MSTTQSALPSYNHRAGAGPALVFLHYWGGSARTWDVVLDLLPRQEAVSIDFRGWGRSRGLPGPFGLEQLAEDTLAVIDEAGIDDYVLVGHSMGGKVAQLIAATRPAGLRGAVLVGSGPAVPAAEITPEYQEQLSHAYDTEESAAGARDHVLTSTPLSATLAAQVLEDSRASVDDARTEWPLRGIAEDVSDRTLLIDVPSLVVAGERDRVEPVVVLERNLVPYLADADFVVLPRTGHLMPLEAPEALAAAIAAFVADLP
ncbi:alpha/beta fold hydrolase [Leifsonia virtsii]|uniref:Alpha/beta hydrolase n=1 Tax=Leifsonia virtsii TaxID=3035915 RepID=A0ABT8IW93_9MICO|nr:alpha/beta hydrolase [Leifsonia virtsii]MDN4597081.1 alpha/beta hydrolase [Leifsonia virtsii]